MAVRTIRESQSRNQAFKRTFVHFALVVDIVIVLMHFLWLVSTSLKTPAAIFKIPTEWIPNPVVWANYPNAMTILPFGRFILKTGRITALAVVGATLCGSLAAFAFARLRWRACKENWGELLT